MVLACNGIGISTQQREMEMSSIKKLVLKDKKDVERAKYIKAENGEVEVKKEKNGIMIEVVLRKSLELRK